MGTKYLLKGGRLIDGKGNTLENSALYIEDDKISKVGKADELTVANDVTVIDITGKTVMPGFIDAHMHLIGVKNLNLAQAALEPTELLMGRALKDLDKLINAGFTTIRDVGSPVAVHIKRLIKEGYYTGPRIHTAHLMLSQTAGHGDIHNLPPEFNLFEVCDGPDECRKAARKQFRAGADFIKISSSGGVLSEKDDPRSPQFTVEEIKAIVYEAEAVGSYVASHAQSTQGIKNALIAGVRTIEHGILIDDEGIEMMLERGAILVPTLSIVKRIVEQGHLYGVPEFGLAKSRYFYKLHKQNVRKAYQAGVKIAGATDFLGCKPVEHGGNAEEYEIFVNELGLSPMEAITCGTQNAADALAIGDKTGSLEEGKLADVIVVNGNPLDDITVLLNTDNIEKVFVEGQLLKDR
ncbi:metal-dependent hydrolase family protein [Rubeoparvulum massiliense]|uniref:metal-dependent hydrolase family protein n=1 Tax=Rubeoparvulum massiliense TaxID=1631346 RepID=UPI00065E5952|nr:amidohydrolase family protein [Rubeoparvulum massiliense]